MSNAPPINVFVDLSAFLTGIDASKLAPLLDPVNIKQVYFDFVQGKAGPTFNKLLNIFAQNSFSLNRERFVQPALKNYSDPELKVQYGMEQMAMGLINRQRAQLRSADKRT